jgi:uncharacterized membrane-anchored protein YitT (DUF2179 family)
MKICLYNTEDHALQQIKIIKSIKEIFIINLGLILTASGIYFFKIPNNFATGGVSGIAIILGYFLPEISVGPIMLAINIVLLLIGFVIIGSSFVSKTIYSSIVLSGMVWILERFFPIKNMPFSNDKLLELTFAIILPAIGSAIVFNQNASTGGTDVIAKILNKLTDIDIGKALLLSDFIIVILAGVVFGIDIGMYSLLGLVMKAFFIDSFIESMNIKKQMVIITRKPDLIKEYILKNLHRGATIHIAEGAFSGEKKYVITTILSRAQAIAMRKYIREVDSKAFITITSTSEIIGKGFSEI